MEVQQQEEGSEQKQATHDPTKALDQALGLLRTRDDTRRFCGLAALKVILDNNPKLLEDHAVTADCWSAISATFLERLLRTVGQTPEDATTMLDLAVSILHVFVRILPQDHLDDKKLIKRSGTLVGALHRSSQDTTLQILQILISIASTPNGARALLEVKDWTPILELVPQQHHVLDIVKAAYSGIGNDENLGFAQEKLDRTMLSLVSSFSETDDAILFISWLSDLLKALPARFTGLPPPWLDSLTKMMHNAVLTRRNASTAGGLSPLLALAAQLLFMYPKYYPLLLFNPSISPKGIGESKPISFLFLKLLLIDIRSTISSLSEIRKAAGAYTQVSARLAASYDITSAFIGYLVQRFEAEEDLERSVGQARNISSGLNNLHQTPFLPADLLLALRADISLAMSLTIEYLLDRYDGIKARTAGSHRLNTEPEITPNDSFKQMLQDSLTIAQLRTLALWLRDDDGSGLREEASNIMDFLLACFTNTEALECASPALIAMEGITAVPEGVEAFLAADGWTILAKDLKQIQTSPEADAAKGVQIVRVLLNIIDSEAGRPSKQPWMGVLEAAVSMDVMDLDRVEFSLALVQLALELLRQAPRGVRRKYGREEKQLLEKSRAITRSERAVSEDMKEGFEEVIQGLEELNVSSEGWALQ